MAIGSTNITISDLKKATGSPTGSLLSIAMATNRWCKSNPFINESFCGYIPIYSCTSTNPTALTTFLNNISSGYRNLSNCTGNNNNWVPNPSIKNIRLSSYQNYDHSMKPFIITLPLTLNLSSEAPYLTISLKYYGTPPEYEDPDGSEEDENCIRLSTIYKNIEDSGVTYYPYVLLCYLNNNIATLIDLYYKYQRGTRYSYSKVKVSDLYNYSSIYIKSNDIINITSNTLAYPVVSYMSSDSEYLVIYPMIYEPSVELVPEGGTSSGTVTFTTVKSYKNNVLTVKVTINNTTNNTYYIPDECTVGVWVYNGIDNPYSTSIESSLDVGIDVAANSNGELVCTIPINISEYPTIAGFYIYKNSTFYYEEYGYTELITITNP